VERHERPVCVVAALGAAAAVALGSALPAKAAGGRYVFDGGTAREQATVREALDASAFPWSLVPTEIAIHIRRGAPTGATAGTIALDADLLDSGRFAWGVVQHEYAHQVDFFLLDAARRAELASALGGRTWWRDTTGTPHDQLTSERFASTLAWSYWPSQENVMRPTSGGDEAGALPPADFRFLLEEVLGIRLSPRPAIYTKGNIDGGSRKNPGSSSCNSCFE
jgi:hypothetical protein